MPHPIPESKIVAAYGLRKCPKLVEQISGSDLQVRINALSVACDELLNPYSVFSCVESGIVSVLASMVSDKDFTTREKASKCLAVLAQDSNGLEAIIREEVVAEILLGRQDPTEQVRGNVYECLLHVSRTIEGADACSAAGTTAVLVDALRTETLSLKSTILQYLYNVASTLSGLMDAIESGAIQIIIELLDCENSDIRGNAAKTLGFICFDESGKTVAIKDGAIPKLLDNLVHPNFVLSNVLFALMAITSTDEGKRQCGILTEDNRLDKVIQLLTHADESLY
eukprot:CAMPEP_0196765066 /NCGR_PEP_ID=MMETSP1095-20130614/7501_1 /TAXON_ID=96789 ORGANISM="Chromulina nebulosa, Strain UTEXLB2642" /NCGR_SAMPLE_ID=MMETSP1095 /ASSEMBLY_ACC=CAM_ASM_000446 /LENGTH=282 /DNA_ID=CAMNT_0042122357 /DNA_START=59 /DNA_END=908 /DNA_ORIENTATION=+